VVVEPGRLDVVEFDLPDVPSDAGLLRVEATGVCGTDVRDYNRRDLPARIMGHEIVGTIHAVGDVAARQWGVVEGDRVLLEEYLPCGHCPMCRSGEYRLCPQTDILINPNALRYGATGLGVDPGLWGGYGQYVYLHPQTILHRVPEDIESRHVPLALPLSNGYEWACLQGQASVGECVVIIGPGQQGLSCLLAAKLAGATPIVVGGLGKDKLRLDLARELGADRCVNIEEENLVDVVAEVTGGAMAHLALDTAASTSQSINTAMATLRKRGRLVVGARRDTPIELEFRYVRERVLSVRGVRGHSYHALEWALAAVKTYNDSVTKLSSGWFPLGEVEAALTTTGDGSSVHVCVDPWA
jgi:threonine dehydrogenase-like Zn-dependent dehydrogenase